MILPKEFFDKIEYFEHTVKVTPGPNADDVFTLHFKSWWRGKRVIKIARRIENYDAEAGTFSHRATPGAADLYNQLNDWATQTFQEKLDSTKRKYTKQKGTDNVVVLKPRPKDINDET